MSNTVMSITEAYLSMYGKSEILSEAVHHEIQSIMDNDNIKPKDKFNHVTRKVRELAKKGEDTGLENGAPKKGSSRAVFFPKEHKDVTIDGHKAKAPTAVKIAMAGTLDKHHGEDTLLGEDQNRLESDHFINRNYGILHHSDHGEGMQSSKHESGGVLAPVFHSHPDYHHLEMGRVEKADAKGIKEATKTNDYPKGLTHCEIYDALGHEHASAHGTPFHSKHSEEHLEHVKKHPWVEHSIDMMHNSDMHPADLNPRNMGIYTHPVTKKKHLAIIDYGYSDDIGKKYTRARRFMAYKADRARREY